MKTTFTGVLKMNIKRDFTYYLNLYGELGFSIFPCKTRSKKPAILSWKPFQEQHPIKAELQQWAEEYPDANIAIVTGKISRIIIVDSDGSQGEYWAVKNLPMTPLIGRTKKGRHRVYRHPAEGTVKSRVKVFPEIDIRAEGGYIIAPPSVHESGHQYFWEDDGYLTPEGIDSLPIFPVECFPSESDKKYKPPVADILLKSIPDGIRDDSLTRIAGWFSRRDIHVELLYWILDKYNTEFCKPPLSLRDIDRIAFSIDGMERKKREDFWREDVSAKEELDALRCTLSDLARDSLSTPRG